MNACNHCNFKNTSKCVENKILNDFEEGLIDKHELNLQLKIAIQNCYAEYYDHQLERGNNDKN